MSDKIKDIEQELAEEDYESVKYKLTDIRKYEPLFKEAARSFLNEAVEMYKAFMSETIEKMGYTDKNISQLGKRSLGSFSNHAYIDIIYRKDTDAVVAIGIIQVTPNTIKIIVQSDVYETPRQYVIKYS